MAGAVFELDASGVEALQTAMKAFRGDTETTINDVLHNEASPLAKEAIYRLMPRSNKKKGRHAKDSKSLSNVNGNLSVTIVARGKWGYLYFPDDGTNTRRHVGNQQFFARGGEAVQSEIVQRCINKLTTKF